MPPPAFAEVRRREQPVDDLFVSVRRLIGSELIHLGGRGRNSDQIEIDTPQQRRAIGVGDRLQTGSFQLGEDESVDCGGWPTRCIDVRNRRRGDRAERPELLARFDVDLAFDDFDWAALARIGGTHLNPLHEVGDDFVGELSFRRHFETVFMPQRLDQQTVIRLSRNDRRP